MWQIDKSRLGPTGETSGTLTIEVGFDGKIGTLGLVYDSSNGGGNDGTVVFSDLRVDNTVVRFLPPPMKIEPRAPSVDQFPCTEDGVHAGELVIPEQEGAVYESDTEAGLVEPGEYTVTAAAADGYELKGDTEWTFTVNPVDECAEPKPEPDDEGDRDTNGDKSDQDDKKKTVGDKDDDTKPVASSLP